MNGTQWGFRSEKIVQDSFRKLLVLDRRCVKEDGKEGEKLDGSSARTSRTDILPRGMSIQRTPPVREQ